MSMHQLNYYYDILDDNLRNHILQIICKEYGNLISKNVQKNYYRIIAQKMALVELISYFDIYDILTSDLRVISLFDPDSISTVFVLEKALTILNKNTCDISWWYNNLIAPAENGLMFLTTSQNNYTSNYWRTEYACDDLIEKLNLSKNSLRTHSLS